MRVIKGKHKGRRLVAPKNIPTRPTTDFAKEGLFNILDHKIYFEGLRVLDLFSGTGNIGLEFSSRGAETVLSVEQNRNCIAFQISTIKNLDLEIRVSKQNVFKFLKKENEKAFDLIFADPPYQSPELIELPDLVFANNWLDSEGWFILEHGKEHNFEMKPHFRFTRKFGHVNFSFFSASEED